MKDTHQLDSVFTAYPLVRYKKHEVIYRATDTPTGVFQIQSGYVRLYSIAATGEELTLLILKPYDFFPSRWAIGDLPMRHVLEAMTDVVAWKAPKEEFLSLMQSNNTLLFEFTHRMIVRVSLLYDRMNELAFGTSKTKIASVIRMCADSFGKATNKGIQISVPLTHKDIANLAGVTRETASIELKALERKGIVTHEHHIITLNIEKGTYFPR